MARVTMTALIDRLRLMTSASRTDTFQGVTYWTDDQLEDVLDEARVSNPVRIPLKASSYKISGNTAWWVQTIALPRHYGVEDNVVVYDDSGNIISTNDYTLATYGRFLEITFNTSNVSEDDFEAELTLYNMNHAAGEVWARKAAQRQALVDVRSGVHQIKASQERDFCEQRSKYYFNKSAKMLALPDKLTRFRSSNSTGVLR